MTQIIHAGVMSHAPATSKRFRGKTPLVNGLHMTHDDVMDDAIAIVSRPNFSWLRIQNGKTPAYAWPVGSIINFIAQISQLQAKLGFEFSAI